VGLFLKVLRSASGNASDRLEVKLVQKSMRMPGQEAEPRPFMSFTARVRRPGTGQPVAWLGDGERARGGALWGLASLKPSGLSISFVRPTRLHPLSYPQGSSVSIVQDLPISKPFVPSDIDRVAQAKAITTYAPLYLDLASGGDRLQGIIERMKPIGTVLRLVTCKVTRI
jgi:hypothetical protein